MEMPNLYPHASVRADYVVVDSFFALSHHSLRPLLQPSEPPGQRHVNRPVGVVVSPGVDVARRQQLALRSAPSLGCFCADPTHCTRSAPPFTRLSRAQWRCGETGPFVVGMVSRLGPEKAVGLFLLAAHTLVHSLGCADCLFVIIGDGPLKSHLQELARRLDISSRVRLLGFIHKDELAGHVMNWDVAVTTGAWRETFSMVGTDHMALGLPLVTFAAGGMGEYVEDPSGCNQRPVQEFLASRARQQQDLSPSPEDGSADPFRLSRNAVVVMTPTQEALALAVLFLKTEDAVRSSIAYRGIKTVTDHFSLEKSTAAYVDFYAMIFDKKKQYQ
jgi:glycosyltransferase involved in cell wall biosynthesis